MKVRASGFHRNDILGRHGGARRMAILSAWLMVLGSGTASAHVYIFEYFRVGAYPAYEGSGWIGEAYLKIPDESADHLLMAENYVRNRDPDFTFRTDWIDFPAGPEATGLDADFATMGDFLDDYIYDVSDPAMLDEPFSNFILRFSGLLRVGMEDDVSLTEGNLGIPGLPVWVEVGTYGYDGYRLFMGDNLYRLPIVDPENGFYRENGIILATGLYPIVVTYFNHYDPNGEFDPPSDRAGIELYSWHGGGLPWPAGNNMVHAVRGPGTIVPPRVIYQADDVLPLVKGDFNADSKVDILDFQWFQTCYSGPGDDETILSTGCVALDFDDDYDVDADDLDGFQAALTANRDK